MCRFVPECVPAVRQGPLSCCWKHPGSAQASPKDQAQADSSGSSTHLSPGWGRLMMCSAARTGGGGEGGDGEQAGDGRAEVRKCRSGLFAGCPVVQWRPFECQAFRSSSSARQTNQPNPPGPQRGCRLCKRAVGLHNTPPPNGGYVRCARWSDDLRSPAHLVLWDPSADQRCWRPFVPNHHTARALPSPDKCPKPTYPAGLRTAPPRGRRPS